jgi:hypothetical protein
MFTTAHTATRRNLAMKNGLRGQFNELLLVITPCRRVRRG